MRLSDLDAIDQMLADYSGKVLSLRLTPESFDELAGDLKLPRPPKGKVHFSYTHHGSAGDILVRRGE